MPADLAGPRGAPPSARPPGAQGAHASGFVTSDGRLTRGRGSILTLALTPPGHTVVTDPQRTLRTDWHLLAPTVGVSRTNTLGSVSCVLVRHSVAATLRQTSALSSSLPRRRAVAASLRLAKPRRSSISRPSPRGMTGADRFASARRWRHRVAPDHAPRKFQRWLAASPGSLPILSGTATTGDLTSGRRHECRSRLTSSPQLSHTQLAASRPGHHHTAAPVND